MPRPRVLREKGVVIGVHIEYSYARLIEEIARRQEKSVSSLLREVIVGWLEGEARVRLGLQLAAGQEGGGGEEDPLDPLIEVDVEEFEQQLARLEGEVGQLEEAVDRALKSGYGYVRGGYAQLSDLNQLAWRHVERWNSLKRWYYRLRRDLPPRTAYRLSSRMAALKRRLNAVLEKTRARR